MALPSNSTLATAFCLAMQSEGIAIEKDRLRDVVVQDCIESTKLPIHYEHLNPALKNALDSVKSLETVKEALDHFWSLMDSLDTPVLHKLSLDLPDYQGRWPNRWLDRYSAIYASVKELDFAFNFHQGWTSHLELSKLFQKFPGLELLNINSMSSNINIDFNLRNVDRMPPLRSIVLPSTSPYYFLNGLADALKKYGRWPGFESVQVPAESLGGNVEKFLTKDKVKSYDRTQYLVEVVEHPYFYDFPNLYRYR
ncbi:hypothetical protein A7U60_g5818 [Sanghuangporus baumii]|uniref:Uncharacterized protein n=1 Tax=Sanghuangporus baumii TaxID=108892 RepID=A0A9Q5HW35_SANBA|nr:hypothetical protein A7U60_g5818 [Sanghuangporus baumii]